MAAGLAVVKDGDYEKGNFLIVEPADKETGITDKMVKSLTMRYNRARQSQITTELSEIMGGVEAMKS